MSFELRYRIRRFCSLALLASACSISAGCKNHSARSSDRVAADLRAANARLQGSWTLVQFQPDLALEPMLAQVLAVQMGRLTVRFEANRAYINGVGVATERTYRIVEAYADHLRLSLTDESGVSYDCVGDFGRNELYFHSLTTPWQGRGVLQRGALGQ